MIGILGAIFFAVLLCGLVISGIGAPVAIIFVLCVFIGQEKRRQKALAKIQQNLMTQETIVAQAFQNRARALFHRRQIVTLTTSRVIVLNRKILGGYTFQDFQWKDLIDVTISENMMPSWNGADLSFEYNFGHEKSGITKNTIPVSGLNSDQSSIVYTYAHAEEQAWQEKRRIREMEENRASSGGTYVSQSPVMSFPNQEPARSGIIGELEKAKGLMDAGLISDVEYQEIKSKLLSHNFTNTIENLQ